MSKLKDMTTVPRRVEIRSNAPPKRGARNEQSQADDLFQTNPILQDLPQDLLEFVRSPEDDISKHWIQGNTNTNSCMSAICCCYAMSKHVLIEDGDIGLSIHGSEPRILGPGRHFLWGVTHTFTGKRVNLVQNRHIKHGNVHIISVHLGEVGLGLDAKTGNPIILTAGQHYVKDDNFEFLRFSKLQDNLTAIGELSLVRVELGYIGYGYKSNGDLMLLEPGLHLIKPPNRFEDLLNLQVQIVNLPVTNYESKDYVQIAVSAGIYFQIKDAYKVLTVIGRGVKQQLRELGAAALQQIIRSSTLVDIAGSRKVAYGSEEEKRKVEGEPDFYAKMHDEFMKRLHDYVLSEWGVEISNIRIENLQIADRTLAKQIAEQAIEVSKLEAEHMMLDKQTLIITTRANNVAKEIEIKTDAEAAKIQRLAQAEADSIVTKARAQKQKKELEGQGEAEYARLLEEYGLGSKLAELKIHEQAMKGVKQVVYVPHLPKMLGESNPILDTNMMMPGHQQ